MYLPGARVDDARKRVDQGIDEGTAGERGEEGVQELQTDVHQQPARENV